jgi:hypothetical protein
MHLPYLCGSNFKYMFAASIAIRVTTKLLWIWILLSKTVSIFTEHDIAKWNAKDML